MPLGGMHNRLSMLLLPSCAAPRHTTCNFCGARGCGTCRPKVRDVHPGQTTLLIRLHRSFLGELGFHTPVGSITSEHMALARALLLQFDMVLDLNAGQQVGDTLLQQGLGWSTTMAEVGTGSLRPDRGRGCTGQQCWRRECEAHTGCFHGVVSVDRVAGLEG